MKQPNEATGPTIEPGRQPSLTDELDNIRGESRRMSKAEKRKKKRAVLLAPPPPPERPPPGHCLTQGQRLATRTSAKRIKKRLAMLVPPPPPTNAPTEASEFKEPILLSGMLPSLKRTASVPLLQASPLSSHVKVANTRPLSSTYLSARAHEGMLWTKLTASTSSEESKLALRKDGTKKNDWTLLRYKLVACDESSCDDDYDLNCFLPNYATGQEIYTLGLEIAAGIKKKA